MKTRRDILRAVRQVAVMFGEPLSAYRGLTLRAVFAEAEQMPGVTVYWGLWSDAELDQRI